MKPIAIIVDIDGTLAHMNDRSPYDPTKYHEDTVDDVIKDIVSTYYESGMKIIICSGRHDTYRVVTSDWLSKNGIKYDELFMRKTDDNRNDAIIKSEIYKELIEPNYDIQFILDDRNRVVNMWRSLGLKCLQVADGDF